MSTPSTYHRASKEDIQGVANPFAQNLTVSRGTVKIHVQHIISKLGVSDRTQAAVRAIEAGLIETR